MTAPPDPIRTAAEQLARELPLTGEPSQGVISAIAAAFRQQRAEAQQDHETCVEETARARDAMIDSLLSRAEAAEARLTVLEAALAPFARFAEKWDAKPLQGIADEFYAIHAGEDGASLRLSDCRLARTVLGGSR